MFDGGFELVAALTHVRRQLGLFGAADQMQLIGAQPVQFGAILGRFDRADAAEPFGARSRPVAVVVDQRVFRRQPGFATVELGDAERSGQKGFEQRELATGSGAAEKPAACALPLT
jgi:hypothetical protein